MVRLRDCKNGGLWVKPDTGGDLHLDFFEVIIKNIDDYDIDRDLGYEKIVIVPDSSFKFDFALAASTGKKVGDVVLAGTVEEVDAVLGRLKTDHILITRLSRGKGREPEYDYWSSEA